jgi:hypothetical protein
MKININEIETYEIKTPDEINVEDFLELFTKLENIKKIISLNYVNQNSNEKTNKTPSINPQKNYITRKNTSPFFDTREKVLDIMQYGYLGTRKDKLRLAKIIGMSYNKINKRFHSLRKRYNIQPQEVGLIAFPTKENHIKMAIPNYVIKSYTGIFDEEDDEEE